MNPFNVAQYALLARMYGHCLGYPASELVVNIGDAHTYSDQTDGIEEQIKAEYCNTNPTLCIKDRGQNYLTDFVYEDFQVNNYYPEGAIRMPLTIVGGF